MQSLEEMRKELDVIDDQITTLYERRMKVCEGVAEYKIKNGRKVFDKTRENEKLAAVAEKVSTDFNKKGIRELFEQLMSMSRKLQYQRLSEEGVLGRLPFIGLDQLDLDGARVVFQGVEGANNQAAMLKYFGKNVKNFHVPSFRDAMEAIEEGSADYAVLPIENSSAGPVTQVYDLLVEFENYIVGETVLPIKHMLAGVKGTTLSSIERVYSHPQGFEQSTKFFDKHKNYNLIPYSNTAISAKLVSDLKDKSKAAIASERAAKLYDLKIIKKDVNDLKNNYTRFIVIGRDLECDETCDKVSILFSVEDTSGGLYNLIRDIKEFGLNMSKIESRPNRNNPWNYIFFVDFDGNLFDENIKQAVNVIARNSKYFKLLGCYRDIKCK